MAKEAKTNAMRMLDRQKVKYETIAYECDEFVDDNTLTVNVNRLRKKLEGIGAVDYLKTKRGQGYILMK